LHLMSREPLENSGIPSTIFQFRTSCMGNIRESLGLLSLLVLAACSKGTSPFVEQHEITTGRFNGLAIGMSRAQTLGVVKTLGAHVISATPCLKFRIPAGAARSMPSPPDFEGVRLTDRQNHFQDLYFTNGKVTRIAHTAGIQLVPGAANGVTTDDIRKILSIRKSNDGLFIAPIADSENGGILTIDDGGSLNPTALAAHGCWRFEIDSIAPAGAVYEIEFGPLGLKRILYRRPRIRSE
jgi:hypothetical protein